MFTLVAERLARLRIRYAEPHRFYHGQAHIDAMLAGVRDHAGSVSCPAAMELATWYHDAVYDPAAPDNEARSAALLRAELAGIADPALLDRAARLIGFTADHRLPTELEPGLAADAALFLDLDMAVLGAAPDAYDAYERGIAAEFGPVFGAARFREGRSDFIRTLLRRPRIFHTETFHASRDGAARNNLRRALDDIGERHGPA